MDHIPQGYALIAVWSLGLDGSPSLGPVVAWRELADAELVPVVVTDGMAIALDSEWIFEAFTDPEVAERRHVEWQARWLAKLEEARQLASRDASG